MSAESVLIYFLKIPIKDFSVAFAFNIISFAPLIFIECKNYTHDPKNPEYDQLVARFHDKRGRFGILVCRTISDKKIKNSRCGDIIGGGTGCVIVLEDKDILELIAARNKDDFNGINDIMSRKLTEVLLNAH